MAVNETPTDNAAAEPVRSEEGRLAQTSPFQTLGLVLGVVGGTAIAFGAILYAIDPGVLPLAVANVVFGAICFAFYLTSNRRVLARAVSGRSTPLILLEIAMGIGVLGAAFAVCWLSAQDPIEWDLTADGIFTLHPQSKEVAGRLEEPITVYGFYGPESNMRGTLEAAIDLYRMETSLIELKLIDPDKAPSELVKKFELGSKSARIVLADAGLERFAKVKRPTEEALTNALIQVAERRERKVYFLEGHGEPDLSDDTSNDGFAGAGQMLGNEGLTVEKLSLVGRSDVPDDASAVMVVGPKTPLFPNETEALKIFLDRGGRVGLLLEPGYDHGLNRLLRPYGVDVGDDIVIDDNPASKALGFGTDAPVVQSYEPHPITRVMQGRYSMFYRARSVSPMLGLAQVSVSTLIQTSDDSFAETSTVPGAPELDADDLAGPVPIAVAVTKRTGSHPRTKSEEARLIVFGDEHFASNRFASMRGNVDLFINSVSWLVGDEDRITIRPPKRTGDRLPITQVQQYGIMFFSVNLLPLLIWGAGLSIWAVRRRR